MYPAPVAGAPLSVQPRAIGALSAFDEGMNLVLARPALFGLLPIGVLLARLSVALLLALAAGAFGIDWLSFSVFGQSPFQLPQGFWTVFGFVVAGLLLAEHCAIHLLLVCLPRASRRERTDWRDAFAPKTVIMTGLVRVLTYLAFGAGFLLLGVGTALAMPLALAPFYAADQRLDVYDAVKCSTAAVLRHFGTVLLFEFISLGLLLCGLFVCGVGLIPAYILVTASRAALYEQLTSAAAAR